MKLEITCCPRCHENHGIIEFSPLDNALGQVDHWAMCPVSQHPILINFMMTMHLKLNGEKGFDEVVNIRLM